MLVSVSVFYHPHALGLALCIPRTASPEVLAYDIVVDGLDHCVSVVNLVQKVSAKEYVIGAGIIPVDVQVDSGWISRIARRVGSLGRLENTIRLY